MPANTKTETSASFGLILLLGSLTAFGAISIDLYLPALPSIAADLDAPVASAQLTMSAFLAGMALGQLGFGPLSDRVGRRIPLLLGAGIYTAASLALIWAGSIELMAFGRFVQAIGACSGVVVARAVVRDRFDTTETARLFSLMFLVLSAAPLLAPSLGAFLLKLAGWESIFLVLAGFGLVSGLAVWLFLPESRSAETALQAASETPLESYVAALKDRRVLGMVLTGAMNGAALFTYIAVSPALFMQHFGASPEFFGILFAINALGMILTTQINRYMLKFYSPAKLASVGVIAASLFSGALLLLAILGLATLPATVFLLFCSFACHGFVGGNSSALALGAMPLRAGSISAAIGTASFAFGAVASALITGLAGSGPIAIGAGLWFGFTGSAIMLYQVAGVRRWEL